MIARIVNKASALPGETRVALLYGAVRNASAYSLNLRWRSDGEPRRVSIVAVILGVMAWLCWRLLRWARSGSSGAHMLGGILTEVTQSPALHEAKQGKKLTEDGRGDPPNEE